MAVRFPRLIHVVREDSTTNDDEWYFEVRIDGVESIDEPGREVAIYKLVKTARVRVDRSLYNEKTVK